jgi:hypothetical protein
MAFPTIENTTGGSSGDQLSSHTISLPEGEGSLLVVFIAGASPPQSFSFPEGWTQIVARTISGTLRFEVWTAVGAGGSIEVDSSGGTRAAFRSYRIAGASGNVEAGSVSGEDTDAPHPPALSPSWGQKDTLWLTGVGASWVNNLSVTAPSNYTNVLINNTQFIETGATYSARRENSVATEEPEAFSISASRPSIPAIIAIEPEEEPQKEKRMGKKIVPIEPTAAMIEAGATVDGVSESDAEEVWEAMVAAVDSEDTEAAMDVVGMIWPSSQGMFTFRRHNMLEKLKALKVAMGM